MDALKELSLVFIMIVGPVLCVVLWQKHKERKYMKEWRSVTNWENLGKSIQKGFNEGYANQVAKQRQKRLDDHTFKTVEEYRHELD